MPAPGTCGSPPGSDRYGRAMPPPIRAPELAELETLVVCAAEGSLAGAAARLGISRPAVAKRIRNLEALAGRRLLDRGARGVRLTGDGATLLAGARRLLDERDALMGTLTELRAGDGETGLDGVRDLLGRSAPAERAAQRPEARLAETERLLAIVLGTTATGVVISDPDTALVREVNEAFSGSSGATATRSSAGGRRSRAPGTTRATASAWSPRCGARAARATSRCGRCAPTGPCASARRPPASWSWPAAA